MERWEYQVIHLNVAGAQASPQASPPQKPGQGPAPASTPRPEAVFSKEYLEKEFPGFYGSVPSAGTPAQEHPASQLRGFLNLQGRQGWQFLGFYPLGQLTMIIFRRPLPVQPVAEPAAQVAAGVPGAAEPGAAVTQPGLTPVLERILERLEVLERRLPPPQQPAASPVISPKPFFTNDLRDGEILPPLRLAELEALPRLSTSEAARALGFRSSASLLNPAARRGYPRGLIKRGVSAAMAIYIGSEQIGRGGRERRLWVVLQAPAG